MITLCVLETQLTEDELFLKLLGRERQADVPYYFSVNSSSWEGGWVIFTRLDCAPAPIFRVEVAGNQLVVSKEYIHEVKGWLENWNIGYKITEGGKFQTEEGAFEFSGELRKRNLSKEERKKAGERVRKAMIKMGKKEAETAIEEQKSFDGMEKERKRATATNK